MHWKNAIIKALLWALNPKETRPYHPDRPNKFLIVSTTGLGDTLWSTPAIRALKQTYPDSSISVLTSTIGHQVLQHNPHIDELFVLSNSTFFSMLRFLPALKREKFDAILHFHSSQRLILPFCALLEAPKMLGTAGINKDLDFLLTQSLQQKEQHEIERRLDLAKLLGAHVSDYFLEMPVRKEEAAAVQQFLDGHGVAGHIPIVGLHPGAKNTFKQWPIGNFVEVGRRLTQHLGCQIFVTGDHSEALLVLEIASKIPGAIPIAGELNLATTAALIKRMQVFITNDTGPMHIAFATKTPTVAIFGPTDPKKCGPFHVKGMQVLSVEKTCRPCLGKRCVEPFCLMQIGPGAVYDAALSACLPASCYSV